MAFLFLGLTQPTVGGASPINRDSKQLAPHSAVI